MRGHTLTHVDHLLGSVGLEASGCNSMSCGQSCQTFAALRSTELKHQHAVAYTYLMVKREN